MNLTHHCCFLGPTAYLEYKVDHLNGEIDRGNEFYACATNEGRKGAKGNLESPCTIGAVVGKFANEGAQEGAKDEHGDGQD